MEEPEAPAILQDLGAYLDNSLDPARRRIVEARLADNPELRRVLGRYRSQIEDLHKLFDHVLAEPVPEAMRTLLQQGRKDSAER